MDVTNSATFGCAIERVDLASKFSGKGLRCFRRQRGSGRNAKPQIRQRWRLAHFAKRLVQNRHSRKNARASRGEAVDDRSRNPIVTERRSEERRVGKEW